MKKHTIIIIVAVLIIALVSFFVYKNDLGDGNSTNSCTQEAKICSDGSAVGRIGLNCEFAACPSDGAKLKKLSESEARVIAERDCLKSGESLELGYYNENTQTWWFDANLSVTKDGCNPACVVNETTQTAEINWRCTGLITETETMKAVQKLFAEKYPQTAKTVRVIVDQEIDNHARGSVIFEEGAPGGIFLAVKTNNVWQLVFDGNGAVDCKKMRTEFGFTDELLVPNICD